MFNLKQVFFGERSLTKVAGLFASQTVADSAVRDLLGASDLTASQVKVLGPPDGAASRADVLDRAVEPEQQGIWRTIIRAHLTMGILGLLAGVLLYVVLMTFGNPALRGTPGIGFVALTGFGITFGLMLGGVLALRPDQGRVSALVRRGLQSGKWAVVAHPLDSGQTHQAVASLTRGSVRVVRSF
jgi:hypothetical protein